MIQRIHGKVTFECDRCGEVLNTAEGDFQDALQTLRESGWKAKKIGDDWTHICDECAK
jgi:hypothetical protein